MSTLPPDVWDVILTEFIDHRDAVNFLRAFPRVAYREGMVCVAEGIELTPPVRHATSIYMYRCFPWIVGGILRRSVSSTGLFLTSLVVEECVLGRRQLQMLCRLIETSPGLSRIVLRPLVTDHYGACESADLRRLLRALPKCPGLACLSLSCIASSTTRVFLRPAGTLTELRLDQIMTPGSLFGILNAITGLRVLELRRCRGPRVVRPGERLDLPGLRELYLTHLDAPRVVVTNLLYPHTLPRLAVLEYTGTAMPFEATPSHDTDLLASLRYLLIMIPDVRLADLGCLMLTLTSCTRLHRLTLGGVTKGIVSSALYHRLSEPMFVPTLRAVAFPDCRLDSFILQIALLASRRPKLLVTWTERICAVP
jgi:hypothetical protein